MSNPTRPSRRFSFYVATFVTEKADYDYIRENVPGHCLSETPTPFYHGACMVFNLSGKIGLMDLKELKNILAEFNLVDNECFIAAVRGAF